MPDGDACGSTTFKTGRHCLSAQIAGGVLAPLSVIGDAAIEGCVLCAKAPPPARTPAP
jgi:hypothetical protein